MTDTRPFLSVITVCYNAASTIAAAVESVCNQTESDLELVIIDGASADNTLEVVRSVSGIRPILISEPDRGIYDAMNKGVQIANGRYIAFLNADDTYLPEAVAHLKRAAEGNPADIFYGDIEKVRHYKKKQYLRRSKPDLSLMPRTMGIFHPASFVKRELFFSLGLFDTSYSLAADYHWFLRAWLQEVSFCYIPEVFTRFYIGGRSNSSCTSYSEAAAIQREFNTGYQAEMMKLYATCRKKARRQRLIDKFVHIWPFKLIYEAYLRNKWR